MEESYLALFAHLHTDISPSRWSATTRYRAPHKPLLLLSVIDLFAEGRMSTNLIELSPELGELFTLYWARVMPSHQRGNLIMPFFHLKSDGFWHLTARPGRELVLEAARRIHSIGEMRETVVGARLDGKLYEQLFVEDTRNRLRSVLIETYFAPEVRPGLVEQGLINTQAFQYSEELLRRALSTQPEESTTETKAYASAVRDQGFRRAVIITYDHRCALCGIRMLTADGHTAVDAAHIIPWSVSRNDNPRNGMALCRLCHWTFDEGLMTVSSHYRVQVSPQLSTSHNVPGHLATLAGRGILGPNEEPLWPDLDALGWHREKVFRGR